MIYTSIVYLYFWKLFQNEVKLQQNGYSGRNRYDVASKIHSNSFIIRFYFRLSCRRCKLKLLLIEIENVLSMNTNCVGWTGGDSYNVYTIYIFRELQSPEYKTSTGVGSPAWMAPEVVLAGYKDSLGEQSQYDERIDVWAVGKSDLTISLKMSMASSHGAV